MVCSGGLGRRVAARARFVQPQGDAVRTVGRRPAAVFAAPDLLAIRTIKAARPCGRLTRETVEVFVGAPPWLGAFETDFPGPGTLCVFNDPERARAMQERATFAAPSARLVATHGIRLQARTRDRGPRKFHLGPARSHDRGSRIAGR